MSESDYSEHEVFSSLYEEEEDLNGDGSKEAENFDGFEAFKQKSSASFGGGRGQKSLPDTLLS